MKNEMEHDWKLTANALGELDEDDRARVETQLRESPELQRTLHEIRAVAEELRTGLRAEPGLSLTPAQREAIIEKGATERYGQVSDFASMPSFDSLRGDSAVTIIRTPGSKNLGHSRGSRNFRLIMIPSALAACVAVAAGVTYLSLPSLSGSRTLSQFAAVDESPKSMRRTGNSFAPATSRSSNSWPKRVNHCRRNTLELSQAHEVGLRHDLGHSPARSLTVAVPLGKGIFRELAFAVPKKDRLFHARIGRNSACHDGVSLSWRGRF